MVIISDSFVLLLNMKKKNFIMSCKDSIAKATTGNHFNILSLRGRSFQTFVCEFVSVIKYTG